MKQTSKASRDTRWLYASGAQHIAACEETLKKHGCHIPPTLAGQSGKSRAIQLYDAAIENGIEVEARARAGEMAGPRDGNQDTSKDVPSASQPKAAGNDLWAQFNAIADPGERTAFYSKHREQFLLMVRR